MQKCETERINGLLISFDFLKAFDSVEWESLFLALESFGFGAEYIKMVKILYKDPWICASNNGYWSEFFQPTRATRQGCCYSPGIFNLVVELLGLGIRQNKNIIGIELNGREIKAGQFADDLWATIKATQDNLDSILEEIEDFGKFSGLHINPGKCAILKLGPFRNTEAKFYTLKRLYWSPTSLKILGYYVYPDTTIMYHDNYIVAYGKALGILENWSFRQLSPIGKIEVVNSLVNSLFSHLFLALPSPPTNFFTMYRHSVLDFIWSRKKASIRYEYLIQDHDKLGLKLVDLEIKDIALKASWAARWKDRDTEELAWFFHHLPVQDSRIWDCNMNPKDIDPLCKFELSSSWSIWKAWCRYHYKPTLENCEEILFSIIWGNSLIKRQNQPLFHRELVCSTINYVFDIFDPATKKLFTYEQLVENHGVILTPLFYLGILAAIPKIWKIKLLQEYESGEMDFESKLDLLKSNDKPTRKIYWEVLEEKYPNFNTIASKQWQVELQSNWTEEEWCRLLLDFYRIIKPVKLRYFQFRVLNKRLTTNRARAKCDSKISSNCTFCAETEETTIHLLFHCRKVHQLWVQLASIIKYFYKTEPDLSLKCVILNNYKGPNECIINFLIICLKQYIYAQKCFEVCPSFQGFMEKLAGWYFIDKCYAEQNNKVKQCVKKWKDIF